MIISILVGLIIFLSLIIAYIIKEANKVQKELITAIIAKSLPEYALSLEKIKTTPKDKLKQTKAENELAIANERMFQESEERGIPINWAYKIKYLI